MRRILGIDPGLRHTGWGIITYESNKLGFVAAGRINPSPELEMAERLRCLSDGLKEIITLYGATESAIEETFVNRNAASALKLGQARGAAMLTAALCGLTVAEYAANRIKQTVTGHGHAEKQQIQAMISLLLPQSGKLTPDAADALAVAICHAHHKSTFNFARIVE